MPLLAPHTPWLLSLNGSCHDMTAEGKCGISCSCTSGHHTCRVPGLVVKTIRAHATQLCLGTAGSGTVPGPSWALCSACREQMPEAGRGARAEFFQACRHLGVCTQRQVLEDARNHSRGQCPAGPSGSQQLAGTHSHSPPGTISSFSKSPSCLTSSPSLSSQPSCVAPSSLPLCALPRQWPPPPDPKPSPHLSSSSVSTVLSFHPIPTHLPLPNSSHLNTQHLITAV